VYAHNARSSGIGESDDLSAGPASEMVEVYASVDLSIGAEDLVDLQSASRTFGNCKN
jgi:hypothetical protein